MKTYSFTDVSFTISHPKVGKKVAQGEGIGEININMANDRTVHDVSGDGSVMVSKIKARNGVISIVIQQTSSLHAWLLKWYNYLESASTSEWANSNIVIRATTMKETTVAIGVSPQKLPDKPYRAQGQNITWNLMAADIQQDPV